MNRLDALKLNQEQKEKYNKCYKEAAKYYNLPKGWVLHHTDWNLEKNDIERYIEWRIEDLQPMTKSEHMKIHCSIKCHFKPMLGDKNGMYGKGYKIAGEKNGMYGIHRMGGEAPMYGKKLSDDAKQLMSAAKKGKHWKLVDGKRVWYTDETE